MLTSPLRPDRGTTTPPPELSDRDSTYPPASVAIVAAWSAVVTGLLAVSEIHVVVTVEVRVEEDEGDASKRHGAAGGSEAAAAESASEKSVASFRQLEVLSASEKSVASFRRLEVLGIASSRVAPAP